MTLSSYNLNAPRTASFPIHYKIIPAWRTPRSLANTSAAESASASNTLLQLLHLDNFRGIDALEDELGDTVVLLDDKVHVAVVEQQDLDLASVVGIDDARAGVDEILRSEPGPWGNATVWLPINRCLPSD
jgi:hypothetical protein